MGWAVGFDSKWNRDIGYGVPAYCDEPGCDAVIDRGLSYACCDSQPHGGDYGCGLYFCGEHHKNTPFEDVYPACGHGDGYTAKPDHPDWIRHKLTDPSWAGWRSEHPEFCVNSVANAPSEPTKQTS